MSLVTGFLPVLILKSTLLLLGGFAAARLLSGSAAAARHTVWMATLAGLAALPLAAASVPAIELAILPATVPSPAGMSEGLPAGGGPRPSRGERPGIAVTPPEDAASGRDGAAGLEPSAVPGAPAPSGIGRALAGRSAGDLAWAIYFSGAGLILAHLGLGLLRVRAMRRRAEHLNDFPAWQALLSELGADAGERVHLYRSRDVDVPFTWGFLRPSILLPWEAGEWSLRRRRDALVHELSHVDRRDWLTQLSARLICAFYWFHPMVWIASRNLFLEAERTCDDRVLASGTRSHDYAQHLLELAAHLRASRVRLEGAVAMARRRQLPVRIEAILDDNMTRSSMSLKKKLVIGLLSMAPALILAPAHLTQARAEPSAIKDGTVRGERLTGSEKGPSAGIREGDESDRRIPGEPAGLAGSGRGASRTGHRVRDVEGEGTAKGTGEAEGGGAAEGRFGAGESRNAWFGPTYVEATDEMTPLMVAAARGDLEMARLLVDRRNSGIDLDEGRPGLGTPLILAANNGHDEMVRFLLDRGADANAWETAPNRVNNLPRSALAAAARAGHEGIVELLLDRQARVDAAPSHDATALMEAARHGHLGIARLLLDRGASANLQINGEGTPLIAAADGGSVAIAELLLDRGADPRGSSSGDGNPLIGAARSGNTEMVRLLLDRGADPDDWVSGDESGLYHAVRFGDVRMVEEMIDRGADVNARWPGDGSPLIVASRRGDREIVDALLRAGADPDLGVDGDGNPLIQAALRGSVALVARLVEDGADVNTSVEGDGSPLIAAARRGHLDVVTFLVNAGADVNMSVRGDENPLVAASGGGHLDVVRFLVERGADVNARFVEHGEIRTPLSMALKHGHHDVAEYLRSRGAR